MRTLTARVCLVGLFPLTLSSAALAQSQNIFFVPPAYPGVGQAVTADFNHDGKPDLVSADGTVMLGNGDGTFATGTALGARGRVIATADFNGDGKPDVVLADFSSPNLYVFLGNGDGTFQAPVTTNLGTPLVSLAVADVNGDGKPDVLGVVSGTAVLVLLGKGGGTFAPGVTYPVLSNSVNLLAVGDFNGDGKLDIALAANSGTNTPGPVGVLLGNGDGTFQTAITSTGVSNPTAIVAKDFNGDGKLDLAVSDSTSGETFVLLGNGNGTFQPPASPLPATGILAAVDLNGDGKPDLVVGGSLLVEVFLGKGDGTFTAKGAYFQDGLAGESNGPQSIAIADFNVDGKLDVAIVNTILLGNGDGTLQGNPAIALGDPLGLGQAVAGDFNRDGALDIAVASANNLSDLYILLNDGSGKFSLAHTYTLVLPATSLAVADLNGDGKLDLLFTTAPVNQGLNINVMLGNGDGTFAPPMVVIQGAPGPVTMAGIADFNGDHKPDLAVLSPVDLTVFLGKGDGTFASPLSSFAGSAPTSLVAADLNNDGKIDVAVASSAGLGILLGKGDGTFQSATFSNSGVGQVMAAADLSGDGNADLIASSSGSLQVLLGKGDGTFNALPPTNQPVGQFLSVVDVNGDGKLDLVEPPNIRVALGNGDGTFGNPITVLVGGTNISQTVVGANFILVADFNGDHRPDVAFDGIAFSSLSGPAAGVATLVNIAVPSTPDFQISASALSPATVMPGGSASSTVTLTPVGGFNASVTLSCTGLPSGAQCNFTPSSVPNGGTSTLTITTAAPSMGFVLPAGFDSGGSTHRLMPLILILMGMTMVAGLYLWRRNQRGGWVPTLALGILVCIGMTIASCGGGSSGGSGGSPGTQAGTYSITVSGSFTSGSTTLTHATKLTLVVQ